MRQPAIGIDIGGTTIKGGIVSGDGEILAQLTIPTESIDGPDAVIARIVTLVRDLLELGIATADTIEGVGIGCPGPLSQADGIVYQTANMPGWDNIPIRQRLHEALDLEIILENDGNAAAWGEFTCGAGRGANAMVLMTLGTGVGGGLIVDGRLLQGGWSNAGEIGHMIVQPDGHKCSCGQRGCLERYASANAVAQHYLARFAADGSGTGELADRARAGAAIEARDVVMALDHDPLARQTWDDACRYLAIACVNLQHIVNPHRIVFGGGMSIAGDALLAPLRAHFDRLTWSFERDRPSLERATLGADAGLIGAACLCFAKATA